MSRGPSRIERVREFLSTPARMVVALLVAIFAVEFAVMATLGALAANLPWWMLTLIDTAVTTTLVSLFMWLAMIAPLRQALEHERAKAQIVLDHAAEAIITIDRTGTIRAFNRAAERMFGYGAADVIGTHINLIVPQSQRSEHDAHLRRYATDGQSEMLGKRRQVQAQRRDGTTLPVEMSMSEAKVDGERLITAILLDITERKRLEERIGRLAHFDNLTGLPNRASFLEQLDRALALAHRQQHKVGLLFLDLNGFKPVNDALGHEAGDQLLKLVAARLSAQARESDFVARLGGDEFTVILPLVQGRAAADDAAQRIAGAFGQPFDLGSGLVPLSASVGIAIYPDDAQVARDLIRIADTRMYDAKGSRKPVRTT